MTIDTRDHGVIEISENGILEFRLPLLGFEEHRRFVVLYDADMDDSLCWLQSVDSREVCFIIVDPSRLTSGYHPEIPDNALAAVEAAAGEAALRCLMVVPQDIAQATVNLKSPLVINPDKKLAAQVVLEEDYPLRAAISSFKGV